MKNRIFLTICMMFAICASAWAQLATVTGTVSDSEGPLIGASVFVKGTTNGAATDFDGNFSIPNVDPAKAFLEVSYV